MALNPSNLEKRVNHAIICALTKKPHGIMALRKIVMTIVDAQDVWVVDRIQLSEWIDGLLRHMEGWKVVKQNSRNQWVWKGWDTLLGTAPDGNLRVFPARLKQPKKTQEVIR